MNSQNQLILNYLKKGNAITPIEALDMFGCFRLGGRAYDIKHFSKYKKQYKGYKIVTTMIQANRKRFAEYSMVRRGH